MAFPARQHDECAGRRQQVEERVKDDARAAHDPADRPDRGVEHDHGALPHAECAEGGDQVAPGHMSRDTLPSSVTNPPCGC